MYAVTKTVAEIDKSFSLTNWKYGNIVLLCALLGSFFSFFILRNLSWFGVKEELHWATRRIITILGMLLGIWIGGCLEAYFNLNA